MAGKTIVIGLGNPLLRDDAVGLCVAEMLRPGVPPEVTVAVSERGGFELLDLMTGFQRAILIDCLDLPQPRPGRIRNLSLQDCRGSRRLIGQHDLSIGRAFELAEVLGIPMPVDVEIFGIEPADTSSFGEQLSPEVQKAAEQLVENLQERFKQRQSPARFEGNSMAGGDSWQAHP
jgi:hydrogenase maturation protease